MQVLDELCVRITKRFGEAKQGIRVGSHRATAVEVGVLIGAQVEAYTWCSSGDA